MSTASLPYESGPTATARTHPGFFLLRRLHSLTGILFGLYLCVHLLVNATMIQGPGVEQHPSIFQLQVEKIHSLPFLRGVEWSLIFIPLLIHTIYGIYIVVNGRPNVGHYGYAKNWFYLFQRITAVALIFFILFHVGGMYGWFGSTLRFDEYQAFDSTVRHLQASPLLSLIIYPLGVLIATFHLANGFWTGGISWGLVVSKRAQARWGWICVALFLLTTAFGFTAIVATFVYRSHGTIG